LEFKISLMTPTLRILPRQKHIQSTGNIKYVYKRLKRSIYNIECLSSQNRMEYEKRVRAQAKAMAATTDLLS
jgi:hypothetical protein